MGAQRLTPTIAALGPISAADEGGPISLGGTKQRIVLARLAVAHPGPIGLEALSQAVWSDSPPPAYGASLLAYLSRLRRVLGQDTIKRDLAGYRLHLDPQHADWLRFRAAADLGGRAVQAHRYAEATRILGPALELWSADRPLDTLADRDWAEPFAHSLVMARHLAACRLAEAQLAFGAIDEALAALSRRDPGSYDEVPVALAMRASYLGGRQADALAAYGSHRRRCRQDLGTEPSVELAGLHVQMLRRDSSLAWVAPDRPAAPRLLPPRVHRLAGRAAEVTQVTRLLRDEHRVALYGLAGSGKTSLAAEIAHAYHGTVCWVTADDDTRALGTLTELAFRLGLSHTLRHRDLLATLWQSLSQSSDWLLVLDNAGSPDEARWLLPDEWSSGQVLITSLDPTWGREAMAVKVEPLVVDDAAEFVQRRLNRFSAADTSKVAPVAPSPSAIRIADELGGLPLALEQACTYMTQTGMSASTYLEMFQSKRSELLVRGAPAAHPSPAATTWQLLFDDVRRQSPAAAEMLEMASFLSPAGVSWSLLSTDDDTSSDKQLLRLDAVLKLVRCSLVDRDDAELRVHRLVQSVVRANLGVEERASRASAAAAAIVRATPESPDQPATWEKWSALLPQVEALLRAAQETRCVPDGIVGLVCRFAAYLRYRSGLLLAESLIDLTMGVLRYGPSDPQDEAMLYAHRSEIRDDLGRLVEARADILTAVSLVEPAAVRRVDLATARTWARFAHVLMCADERSAAINLYLKAIATFRASAERADLANALIGLAYTRWRQDDYQTAASNCREARDLLREANWTDHPLYPSAISALGMMLHELGECEQARSLQQEALDKLRSVHGDVDHHDVAYVHDKLGYVERLLGHHSVSRAEHQLAADILARLFGERDPRRAVAISNRGLAERALGCSREALESQEHAYGLLSTAFGEDHKLTRLASGRLAEMRDLVRTDEVPR